jgi:hypothetical protein
MKENGDFITTSLLNALQMQISVILVTNDDDIRTLNHGKNFNSVQIRVSVTKNKKITAKHAFPHICVHPFHSWFIRLEYTNLNDNSITE